MKKITILALHDGVGGVEKYFDTLCQMLANTYEIEIIFTYKSNKRKYNFEGAKCEYLIDDISNRQEFKDALKQRKIFTCFREGFKAIKLLFLKWYLNKKRIKRIDSDYIITTRFHSKLVGKYAKSGIVKIATEHNYHNNDTKYVNKILKSIRGFDYFVSVSLELNNFYKSKTDVTCVEIPNTFDLKVKEKSLIRNNTIISVGRFSNEKGYLDFIDVVKLVKKQIPDLCVYLIGDGPERGPIESKIKSNYLDKTITMTGFLSTDEVAKYLRDSSIFVMTSYTESFGIVLLEAMEAGILPIAFDSARGACEVLDNDSDLLVPNRDEEEMAARIVSYLKDKKRIKDKVKKNELILDKYRMDTIKKKWISLLEGDVDEL